mmetsp:Transcript_16613/g.43494  ORF Transcript_16613/g.43494 Transcript_16613/m.43494 type:complete len:389 (+) Transcript_16613:81-1247(+)
MIATPSNLRSDLITVSAMRVLPSRSITDAKVLVPPSSISSVRVTKRCVSIVPGMKRKSLQPRNRRKSSRGAAITSVVLNSSSADTKRLQHFFSSAFSSYGSRESFRGKKNHRLCTSLQRPLSCTWYPCPCPHLVTARRVLYSRRQSTCSIFQSLSIRFTHISPSCTTWPSSSVRSLPVEPTYMYSPIWHDHSHLNGFCFDPSPIGILTRLPSASIHGAIKKLPSSFSTKSRLPVRSHAVTTFPLKNSRMLYSAPRFFESPSSEIISFSDLTSKEYVLVAESNTSSAVRKKLSKNVTSSPWKSPSIREFSSWSEMNPSVILHGASAARPPASASAVFSLAKIGSDFSMRGWIEAWPFSMCPCSSAILASTCLPVSPFATASSVKTWSTN